MLRPLVPLPRLGSRKRDASGNTPLVPVPTAPSTPAPLRKFILPILYISFCLAVNRDIHSYEAPLPLPFLGSRTSDASGNIRFLPEVDPIASSPTVLPPDEPLPPLESSPEKADGPEPLCKFILFVNHYIPPFPAVIGNAHSSKALPPLPYVGSSSARRKAPVATPIRTFNSLYQPNIPVLSAARLVRQMKRKEALGKTSIPRSEMLKIVKELSDKVTVSEIVPTVIMIICLE